jgi:hypothetical protein
MKDNKNKDEDNNYIDSNKYKVQNSNNYVVSHSKTSGLVLSSALF